MATQRRSPFLIGIVDDDVSFREALGGWLNSFGYATRVFASAGEFLQSGKICDIQCLVLDVQMAGMDGLGLQARLNATAQTVPVIFVSSSDDPQTRAHALAAGARGFFGKPVDREAFVALIKTLADGVAPV